MIRRLLLLFAIGIAAAQTPPKFRPYNDDESQVGPYVLPAALKLENGTLVSSSKDWIKKRRPELLHLFETQMFGRTPPAPYGVHYSEPNVDRHALGGRAVRKQLTMSLDRRQDGPRIHLLVYLPSDVKKPVPVFLGLNFSGNQTVVDDPGIELHDVWVRDKKQPAAESSRGSQTQQWQVEKIITAGFGLATIYYGEIEPDYAGGMQFGVRPLFFAPGQTEPKPDEWGAIGAWAWGLGRALDYLERDKDVDAKHVAVMGHSRLGKTALWAGVVDQRFAMVISNDSGEGGAALSKRDYGETIEHLNVAFPHWYCGNYKQYTNHPERLPFDAHELLALVAPRPLYVASAEEDRGSDPRGEFLAAVNAGPVYRLFGKRGLETDQMPALHKPIFHDIAYHIRAGKHDVTAYDWDQYIAFADHQFRK